MLQEEPIVFEHAKITVPKSLALNGSVQLSTHVTNNSFALKLIDGTDFLTRQQAALMMHRVLVQYGSNLPVAQRLTYVDVDKIASYATEAVSILHQLSIMTGTEDGYFNATATLSRAQMAKILYKTLEKIGYM